MKCVKLIRECMIWAGCATKRKKEDVVPSRKNVGVSKETNSNKKTMKDNKKSKDKKKESPKDKQWAQAQQKNV